MILLLIFSTLRAPNETADGENAFTPLNAAIRRSAITHNGNRRGTAAASDLCRIVVLLVPPKIRIWDLLCVRPPVRPSKWPVRPSVCKMTSKGTSETITTLRMSLDGLCECEAGGSTVGFRAVRGGWMRSLFSSGASPVGSLSPPQRPRPAFPIVVLCVSKVMRLTRFVLVFAVALPSPLLYAVRKIPGGPRVQVFVGTSLILFASAVPTILKPKTKRGHDLFSQEKPEAVVASKEHLQREHRKARQQEQQQQTPSSSK